MITDFLVRAFIKDFQNLDDPKVRAKYGLLEGWISVIINIFLFITKLIGGLMVNSISLIADAMHSLSDMISSIAVIWGFKLAAAPPDNEHPYGHGRIEDITTLAIAILLIVTGFEFLKAAIVRIMNPSQVPFNIYVIIFLLITILLKIWLTKFSMFLGKKIDSKALQGDSQHHKTDIYTSIMVLIPLLSDTVHVQHLDGIIGVMISAYIMYSGIDMIRSEISPLIGESATYKELKQIKDIAMSVYGVKGVHDIMMHKYGKVKIISLHAEIPEDIPFTVGHDIIEEVEERIADEMKATAVIHLDPLQKMNEKLRKIHDKLAEIVTTHRELDSYHDVRMVMVKGEPIIILDMTVEMGTSSSRINILHEEIKTELKASFPECKVKLWIEPQYQGVS